MEEVCLMDITADFSYRFSDSWQTHIRLSSATHVWLLNRRNTATRSL